MAESNERTPKRQFQLRTRPLFSFPNIIIEKLTALTSFRSSFSALLNVP